MAKTLLVDTDVCIDYLRGRSEAIAYLEALVEPVFISVVTLAELYAGVRDGDERSRLDLFVSVFDAAPIDEGIALRAGLICRDIRRTHKIGLADAMIAATVERLQAALVTLNKKHFPMLEAVIVPYVKDKTE